MIGAFTHEKGPFWSNNSEKTTTIYCLQGNIEVSNTSYRNNAFSTSLVSLQKSSFIFSPLLTKPFSFSPSGDTSSFCEF